MKSAAVRLAVAMACAAPYAEAAGRFDVAAFDRARVLKAADAFLAEKPITITSSSSPRSAGDKHDFFSEGDYWWPDPANPKGPYIRRDGQTNPDNFEEHRKAMRRLSVQVPALAAAWKLTKERKYADHAVKHLVAWFADPETKMAPHLKYAQAIHGRFTGRATGLIDTLHLVEVARAVEVLKPSGAFSASDWNEVTRWFKDYLHWLVTHPYGIEERDATNNHGTCWVAQAAAFARLTEDEPVLDFCRDRFKKVLVPGQMTMNGSFPQELMRTKPYSYSLFNLEAFAAIAQTLSTPRPRSRSDREQEGAIGFTPIAPEDDLWKFETDNTRGMRTSVAFMFPFIKDKKRWALAPDVQYDEYWPMRQAALLFAGLAYDKPEYIEVWKTLPADSDVDEVIRNFFIRQPVLWVD